MYEQQFKCQPAGINQVTLDTSFSFVKQLNSNDLESLEQDEERIHKFVDDCNQVKQQQSEKESLLASNKSLAEYNLSLEPKLGETKMLLAQTNKEGVEISKRFEHSRLIIEGTPCKLSSDVQLALLQTESAKAEEECEKISSEFLSKKLDVETFLNLYIEKRALSHVRKVKCEKMVELLRQANHRRTSAPTFPAKNQNPPVAPSYSAYINTGASNNLPAYPLPYPLTAQNNSFTAYVTPYGVPRSMPVAAPYPTNFPGTYPQPSLH